MKSEKAKRNMKTLFIALGVLWAIAFFIIVMQIYIMSGNELFIFLSFIIAFLVYLFHHKTANKFIRGNKVAKIILYVYAFLNFIPLLAQFIGFKVPGIDNLFAGIIGFAIIYLLESSTR